MSDPRHTPMINGVAHVSLKGQVAADEFTKGTGYVVSRSTAPLTSTPNGERTRELLMGEGFCALTSGPGELFGFAERDGYCGWIDATHVSHFRTHATHRVSAIRTCGFSEPNFKATRKEVHLSFGSPLVVRSVDGKWACVHGPGVSSGQEMFVPSSHLVGNDIHINSLAVI